MSYKPVAASAIQKVEIYANEAESVEKLLVISTSSQAAALGTPLEMSIQLPAGVFLYRCTFLISEAYSGLPDVYIKPDNSKDACQNNVDSTGEEDSSSRSHRDASIGYE